MEKKLRIAMFSWESLNSITVGGLAPHVTELSEALAQKGHDIHIFTRNKDMLPYEIINGVHYHRVYHALDGGIVQQMDSMCDSMHSAFTEATGKFGKFDLTHVHDWHPVNLVCRLKEESGIPFIMTYHSTEWGRNGNKHGNWWEAMEISHREWRGGYESSKVIVTSTKLKEEIQYLYQIPDDKLSIIPNGIHGDKMKIDIDPGKIKEEYGIHPYAPVVLFVGRMNYQKGPDLFVKAISSVLANRWDAKFVIIGEGEMRPECERLAHEMNVMDSCHFLGYVDESVKKKWMNTCNLICVPSRNEPFGIILLEAWDAGKNIVATDAISLIDNFRDGIIVYQNPDSIAWGINHVFNNYADGELGKEGQKLIGTRYNWDNIAETTVNVYKEQLQLIRNK
ncbi:glycosyltransferase family 4 protein [uncultured Methanolobus sp.]|uniref:glycosyltransferase family 4 protein n=1 Tax=uncultured Methanolobus sp. TaxID=218300 RepID=UPI002AAB4695|nr:glycosyltransferase family 4 protein [uncultured Methanolobus sp.]